MAAMAAGGRAAGDSVPAISFSIAPAAEPVSPATRFSAAQIARVSGWIAEFAPACPAPAAAAAAASFLQELREQHPEQIERVLAPDFPYRDFESALLRCVATQLTGASFESVRVELAQRRAKIVLARRSQGAAASTTPDFVLEKIKALSEVRYRSLLEGRMEDDDLAFYVKRVADSAAPPADAPKISGMTVTEIVAEYARHNQNGTALRRLHAYVAEGRLTPATGGEMQVYLYKMRPDRFRLSIASGGMPRFIQASDGRRFWQQVPGGPLQFVSAEKMGTRRYLAEFVDPLFSEEGYAFEQRPDGADAGGRFYRIAIHRSDGSKYVARIDAKSYREIGREEDDGSVVRYSDFREVAGVTFAFREEVTDREGRKGVLELTRVTANPGLVQDFFAAAGLGEQVFFNFEGILARAGGPVGPSHP